MQAVGRDKEREDLEAEVAALTEQHTLLLQQLAAVHQECKDCTLPCYAPLCCPLATPLVCVLTWIWPVKEPVTRVVGPSP